MQEPRPFFGRIESLRGLGAMSVAGYHCSGWMLNGVAITPHVPWDQASGLQNAIGRVVLWLLPGHAALMMFFAISGFVLHVSLQYGPQTLPAAARRFLIARTFRIYPIVIAGVLVTAWAQGWHTMPFPGHPPRPLDGAEMLANMLLLSVTVNHTLWALQLEVIMAPIILMLFFVEKAYGTRVLLAIGLVTTALSFTREWALWGPLSHNMFAFILGMLVPTLGRQWANGLTGRAAHGWLIACGFVMFAAGPVFGFYSRTAGLFETYAALGLLSIAAYRTDIRWLGFLDNRAVRQLGLASGSYYVLHIALLGLPLAAATMIVPEAWSLQAPGVVGAVVIALSLVAIAPLAVLSFHLVEAPGIALGRRVLQSRRAAATP
jgi:peptidoglycan/LPS O-acetylase OafA/YrhL